MASCLLAAGAVVAAAIACAAVIEFIEGDSCLDAGGRWNYESHQCER